METYTFTATSNWNHAIRVRLAELDLEYDEFKQWGKSTYVLRMWDDQDFDNVVLLVAEIKVTMRERAQKRAVRRAREKAAEKAKAEAKALAKENFFRKITFRKPLTKLT